MVQIDCCASFAKPCYTFKIRAVETTLQMNRKLAAIQTSNSIHGIRRHKLDLVDRNTFNVYSHNVPYLKNHVDFIFCNYLIQCVQYMTCASFWISTNQYWVKVFHDCIFSGCYCPKPCIGNKPQLSLSVLRWMLPPNFNMEKNWANHQSKSPYRILKDGGAQKGSHGYLPKVP